MDYLKRYRAGEHERVWNELRALGSSVRNPGVLGEARLVAETMMQRVRSNMERIEHDLAAIGYEYVDSGPMIPTLDDVKDAVRANADELLSTMPGLDPEQIAQMLEAMNQSFAQISATGGPEATLSAAGLSGSLLSTTPRRSALGDPSKHLDQLNRFEAMGGVVPVAVDAFWRIVGWADFTGRLPWSEDMPAFWQPLVAMPPCYLADDYQLWLDEQEEPPIYVQLIADPDETDPVSCPLLEAQIDGCADTRAGGIWFVDYLRGATRCGGYAGTGTMPPMLAAIAAAWEPF
jgi:hypothetical protein